MHLPYLGFYLFQPTLPVYTSRIAANGGPTPPAVSQRFMFMFN